MRVENLNAKKFLGALSLLSALIFFFAGMSTGNGFILSLLFSLVMAVPIGWLLGMTFAIIYEVAKLCKPLLDWFFK